MDDKDAYAAKGRLSNLADELGVMHTLASLRECRLWDALLVEIAEDVVEADHAADKDDYAILEHELMDANALSKEISAIASRIHEAICEGRRQDAIDILNEITGDHFRSVAEQHNLFPDRIPA